MTRALVIVIALAGCDKLLSLNDITPQHGLDAAIDAGPTYCSLLATQPFVCADFDAPSLVDYESGNPHMLPTGPPATARAPGTSQPNALWIDASLGGYTFKDMSSMATTRIEATFELDVDGYVIANDTVSIVALSLTNADCGPCRIEIQLDQSGGPGIIVAAYASGFYDHHTLAPLPPPNTFLQVDVVYDLASGQASARVGAASPTMFVVPSSTKPAAPSTEIGAGLRPAAIGGPSLALDDVVVTLQ